MGVRRVGAVAVGGYSNSRRCVVFPRRFSGVLYRGAFLPETLVMTSEEATLKHHWQIHARASIHEHTLWNRFETPSLITPYSVIPHSITPVEVTLLKAPPSMRQTQQHTHEH